jgi:hypothetical protein
VITFLWALKGKAVRAQGDWERGRALLQAAVDNATATGERFLLWQLHANLARVCEAGNHLSEARQQLSAARTCVDELAETIRPGKLRDNFLERAHDALRS